jgi:hypothetical protein
MQLIKNKIHLSLFIVFVVSSVFLYSVSHSDALGAASFPQDTTINLGVGNITIDGGSDADSVVTTNTTIEVFQSVGQTFKLISNDRLLFTNSANVPYDCSAADKSSITITGSVTTLITVSSDNCDSLSNPGGSSGSSGGGGGTTTSSSTPTPTPTATPDVTLAPSPSVTPVEGPPPTPVSRGFMSLEVLDLKEGDVISSAGSDDPDVYIVNDWGYKRLFLNPVIFGFYGHLGGFANVKSSTTPSVRDTLVTSGLFRNCETNDEKVYGVDVTGEDTGIMHWVDTTGEQAVADDPDFFKKVFCINSNEFNWYEKGAPYTSVNQIPAYTRTNMISSPSVIAAATPVSKVRVVDSIPWLNVRDGGSLSNKIIDQILPNEEYEYINKVNGWYNIKKDGAMWGWVFGEYVTEI